MKEIINKIFKEKYSKGLSAEYTKEEMVGYMMAINDIKEQLTLTDVSKSVAKQYAEFCVRCDREGLPLLELDDYIKQCCC